MLDRFLLALNRVATKRPRLTVIAVFVVALAAGIAGTGVVDRLASGGFDDPASESSRGARLLDEQLDVGPSDVVLVVTALGGTVDGPGAVAAGLELVDRLSHDPALRDVVSYWTAPQPEALRSRDGASALVLARGVSDDGVVTGTHVRETYSGVVTGADGVPRLEVLAGGTASTYAELQETIKADLLRAESIAIPLTVVLLVLVFGSLVAAGLPLLLGLISIVGALGALFAVTALTDVSVFALNLTIALGLGLGIDYALFIVSRYREELARGQDPRVAVERTMRTAGRTVVFSGLTVIVALLALLIFPLFFLRSFAYAGIAVVAFSMLGAVVLLPAVLVWLGRRVEAGRLVRRPALASDDGAWARVAHGVMRRPIPVALAVTTLLVVLGLPFLRAEWGQADDRSLAQSAEARRAGDVLRTQFDGDESATLTMFLPDTPAGSATAYAESIRSVPGVADVHLVPAEGASYLLVLPAVSANTPEGDELVRALRAEPAPGQVLVTGSAAAGLDAKIAVGERLPWALGFITVSTLLLLFAFTGSVVLPIKALLLNLLSLSATFGAMVWVFQEGNLSDLLGFTPTGTLELGVPVLMFCVAFGLSMDYEVFLLSRIKEAYATTGDNTLAVARGLQRTGAIITAAAGLLAVVFIAFAFSGVTTIKLLGLGIALAVVMDATLVRGLLVPAVMRLAGDWNWWAPAPLRRLHDRFGLHETEVEDLEAGRLDPDRELIAAGVEVTPARMPLDVQ